MSHPENKDSFVPMPPAADSSQPVVADAAPTPVNAPTGEAGTSGLAIAGFVCSIVGLLIWLVVPLVGLVLSIIGLVQTKGGAKKGKGFAIAGVIISSLSMIWGILWLLIFIIGAANSSSTLDDYNYNSSSLSSLSSSSESKVVSGKVAEMVEVEDVQLTVSKVTRNFVAESEYYKPDAGKEYVSVAVDLKNTGSDSLSFGTYSFKVRDSSGLELSSAYVGTVAGELEWGSLAANGGNTKGIVVFEVPKDDAGLVLVFNPSYFGEVAEIKL